MKTKLFLVCAIVATTIAVNAQTTQSIANCRCEEGFEWLRSTFETNDAGFSYIVEQKGRAAYDLHNLMTLEKVKTAQTYSECRALLYEWLTFFRKGHIGIQLLRRDPSAPQNLPQAPEMEIWEGDIAAFEKEMAARQDAGYEGIWDFGFAKLGFEAEGDGYKAFFIELSDEKNWKPREVFMRITPDGDKWQVTAYNYTGGVTSPTVASVELAGNTHLLLGGRQLVKRVSPVFPDDPRIESYMKSLYTRAPYVEELNPTTLYMRIPSFDHTQKAAIDKMIAENFDKLTSTESLIIDVRNNGGGSDISYRELWPLLYTGPRRDMGVEFLSTPLNIEKTLALLDIAELDEETKKEIAALAEKMKAHPGEFVLMGDDEVDIKALGNVYEFPRNVGIIVNEGCGSTTEQFLIAAKQSLKVKLFGVRTYGSLDASNVRQVDSPDGRYRLSYTTSRSLRIPGMAIDEIGLQPDFYLDKTIPGFMWVEFVSGVLNR